MNVLAHIRTDLDLTQIILSAITVLGNVAIVTIGLVLRSHIKTPSGTTIGKQVEQANAVSAVTLAHTTRLLKRNGGYAPTVDQALAEAADEAPGLVGDGPPAEGGGER